jgi:hypothetical protein
VAAELAPLSARLRWAARSRDMALRLTGRSGTSAAEERRRSGAVRLAGRSGAGLKLEGGSSPPRVAASNSMDCERPGGMRGDEGRDEEAMRERGRGGGSSGACAAQAAAMSGGCGERERDMGPGRAWRG